MLNRALALEDVARVRESLVSQGTYAWDLYTVLRGPDIEDRELAEQWKDAFTKPIRAMLGVADSQMGPTPEFSTTLDLPQLITLEAKVRAEERKCWEGNPAYSGPMHFLFHVDDALRVLIAAAEWEKDLTNPE